MLTREETSSFQGHVTGEIQRPYLDHQSLYDSDPQEGKGALLWGLAGIGVCLLAILVLVVLF